MTAAQATAEVFWTAFKALPKREREAIVKKMLDDKEFIEDLKDAFVIALRINEPSRHLNEYLADRKKNIKK